MYSEKLRRYSCALALLISACVPALASVTVFTDRNLWLAATSPITTLDFTGAVASNGEVTINSIDLQGFDHNNPPSSPDLQVFNGNYWGSGAVLEGPAGSTVGQHIIATLPVGTFAVGSDIMQFEPNGPTSFAETITAQLSIDSTIYSAQTNNGFTSRAFIGFVSDTQISSITFFPANDNLAHLALDNFSTGGQAENPAPEAATMLMCGSGILLMVWLFRRSKSSAAEPLGSVA